MTTKIMGKTITKEEITEQREKLKSLIESNGMRVHTVLRHVSKSGMYREISPLVIGKDGTISHIAYAVACVTGMRYTEKNGHNSIGISGCGMDMGFALVYDLSSTLYPDEERGAYKISQDWI
jgi:hypothetical protein